jgi:hypothetical protein
MIAANNSINYYAYFNNMSCCDVKKNRKITFKRKLF